MPALPVPAEARLWAVVVTFNRRALLEKCLDALAAQTRALDRILVVDNASTDGTPEWVATERPDVDLLALEENAGGAGGFHAGLAAAHAGGAEWVWLLDDDTIARPDALAALLAVDEGHDGRGRGDLPRPLLLSSRAEWVDGRLHPMNFPAFKRDLAAVIDAAEHGVIPFRTATFVSLLVHRDAVDRFGLPCREYFIWSDDIEYTARVTRHAPGYFVPDSVVVHETREAHTAITESGGRFYFHVRNSLWMLRSPAWNSAEKLSVLWGVSFTTWLYLRHQRMRRESVGVVLRGVRDGLRPRC